MRFVHLYQDFLKLKILKIKKAFLKNTARLLVIVCLFLKIRYMLPNLFLLDILEHVYS